MQQTTLDHLDIYIMKTMTHFVIYTMLLQFTDICIGKVFRILLKTRSKIISARKKKLHNLIRQTRL
jgi:hypothetical protein